MISLNTSWWGSADSPSSAILNDRMQTARFAKDHTVFAGGHICIKGPPSSRFVNLASGAPDLMIDDRSGPEGVHIMATSDSGRSFVLQHEEGWHPTEIYDYRFEGQKYHPEALAMYEGRGMRPMQATGTSYYHGDYELTARDLVQGPRWNNPLPHPDPSKANDASVVPWVELLDFAAAAKCSDVLMTIPVTATDDYVRALAQQVVVSPFTGEIRVAHGNEVPWNGGPPFGRGSNFVRTKGDELYASLPSYTYQDVFNKGMFYHALRTMELGQIFREEGVECTVVFETAMHLSQHTDHIVQAHRERFFGDLPLFDCVFINPYVGNTTIATQAFRDRRPIPELVDMVRTHWKGSIEPALTRFATLCMAHNLTLGMYEFNQHVLPNGDPNDDYPEHYRAFFNSHELTDLFADIVNKYEEMGGDPSNIYGYADCYPYWPKDSFGFRPSWEQPVHRAHDYLLTKEKAPCEGIAGLVRDTIARVRKELDSLEAALPRS